MKYFLRVGLAAAVLMAPAGVALSQTPAPGFLYEQEREFTGNGDFDGDGRQDVIIIDKASGKYRIGYQMNPGVYTWVKHRLCKVKDLTGAGIGKLFDDKKDALAVTSADANKLAVVAADKTGTAGIPTPIPPPVLGANSILPVTLGGAGKSSLQGLYLSSIYNDPNPNKVTLFRNEAGKFVKFADMQASGAVGRINRISLKTGAPELVVALFSDDKNDTFRVEDLSSGAPVLVASIPSLPAGSDYLIGHFRGSPLADVVIYRTNETKVVVYSVEEAGGKIQFAAGKSFDLEKPIRKIYTVNEGKTEKLLVISGKGDSAGVFDFDASKAPTLSQPIPVEPGEVYLGGTVIPNGIIMLTSGEKGRWSTKYYVHKFEGGKLVAGLHGSLASMDDADDITVPDIYKRIIAKLDAKSFADMKAFTNTIPGTSVTYAMVPIPGGEYTMGSPESEAGRKPEETPHKVKIDPFWMGQCEVTWNEYELFMYPDDEKKLRASNPVDVEADKISDIVTRPSKPYVEMSFGMGKDGFPAISMTQHAANKYCHWLSAKTGHFYRLPTEAEWEYAARAGTTTAYFWGDDASKLGEYAWNGQNSDFKYQKVGKKKANPWGLYDTAGNVLEWCLDQYDPDYYKTAQGTVTEPWNKATKPYPHSARGGSWDDDNVAVFRSAARRGSERAWKATDPQLPKSVWYHSDAQFIGFRIVRPLTVPSAEEIVKCWISGVEKD